MERCYAAARPRTFAALTIDKLLNKSSSLSSRPQMATSVLSFALRTVPILTRTQPNFLGRLGWGWVRARGSQSWATRIQHPAIGSHISDRRPLARTRRGIKRRTPSGSPSS